MWTKILENKPPYLPTENIVVDTKVDNQHGVRNEQKLIYSKGLWWHPDKSMYVYYTTTHWKSISGKYF